MLTAADIASITGWPLRTAQWWVAQWRKSGDVRVALVRPSAGKGRTRYAVDADSFYAAFPQYAPPLAA